MAVTIALASLLNRAAPRPIRVLDRFDYDKAIVGPVHRSMLRHVALHVLATWKSQQPVRVIRLVGHTDARGSAAYNAGLGLRRALAVQREFVRVLESVAPGLSRRVRFERSSLGARQPVATQRSQTGPGLNRRVEVFLSSSP